MSLKSLHEHSDTKIFVSAYTGIGDAILYGPILRSINKLFPGRILYPENPVLTLYKDLNVEYLDNIGTVGKELRHFIDFTPEELIETLQCHKIKFIFNLRRDRIKFGQRYVQMADAINQSGIVIADICEIVPLTQQMKLHTFDLCKSFFQYHGIKVEENRFGWLKENIRSFNWNNRERKELGFYLGAGQNIKRMTVDFWHQLITKIHNKIKTTVILMCGATEEEIIEGKRLSERMVKNGIRHELIFNLSLFELTRFVSRFNLIISCDTFMVHLAESLGIKVFGIYCSTDPKVYGPYNSKNYFASSSFYSKCPQINQIGNCDGWDKGCSDTPCKNFVNPIQIAELVLELLHYNMDFNS